MEQKTSMNILNNLNNTGKNKVFINLFLLLLIVLLLILFLPLNSKKEKKEKTNITLTQPVISPEKNTPAKIKINEKKIGSISLKLINTDIKVNSPFSIGIIGDLPENQAVGIDILIKFDEKKLNYLNAKSDLNSLNLYPKVINGHLSLTFIKKLNEKNALYLSKTKLAEIKFQPLSQGVTEIKLVPILKNRKTFFINEKTEIIYPNLSENLKILIK